MAINFGASYTIRQYDWANWKTVQRQKSLLTQYDDDGTLYTIYGYDGPEVHSTFIYKGVVPPGFNQAQNDIDKLDFETNYKPTANQSIVPRTSDGKSIYLQNAFPGDVIPYFAGAGDDAVLGRGKGPLFALQSDVAGDTVASFMFIDWVYLLAGQMYTAGGEIGDTATYAIFAPASVVTPNPGAGNCNLVDPGVGAPILIVPAVGGAFDVTLATAVPVPAYDAMDNPIGFWDWSNPDTGTGVITPGLPGQSPYNLYSIELELVRYANRIPIVGNHTENFAPPVKPKRVFPQWRHDVTLHNTGHAGLKVGWMLYTARKKTT